MKMLLVTPALDRATLGQIARLGMHLKKVGTGIAWEGLPAIEQEGKKEGHPMNENTSDTRPGEYPDEVPADERPERFKKPNSGPERDSEGGEDPEGEDEDVLSTPSAERDDEIPAAPEDGTQQKE